MASKTWSHPELDEQVTMHQQRIGPGNPGISRFLAARFLLLVMLGLYLGGGTIAVMYYGFGMNPLK